MAYIIGQGGSVGYTVDGDAGTICVETWTLSFKNDAQDVTTTCSAGWVDRIKGISDATLTFTGFYDNAATIQSILAVGDEILFQPTVGPSVSSTFSGNFIVTELSVENPAKTTVKFTVTANSNGPLT